MRIFLTTFVCGLLVGCTGCIIPLPNKVSHGHRHSAAALAFLDSLGTTREEVIGALGPPLLESHESRTLLYEWEETPRFLASVPHIVHRDIEMRGEVVRGDAALFGLFIAYDAQGVVETYEVREISAPTLREACTIWRAHSGKKK
jgi:hypothetical protein